MRKKMHSGSRDAKLKKPQEKSGKMYRVLFDASPVGIGIADLNGNVIDANASMQEMIGYTLEELRKVGVVNTYVNKNDRRYLLETLKKDGKVRDLEVLQKRKDGSIYSILLNADLIELEGSKVLLTTARDITEKKEADEARKAALAKAEEERNKSDAIISAIGDGIMIQDKEYRILYQNQIQKDMFGDHTGEYCYRVFEGRDTICEGCPVELSLRDGKIHRSEKRVVSDRGTNYFEFTASPLKDFKGEIIAGIKVIRDVTERKRAEEDLRISEEKYHLLIDNIHDGVFIIQDARMQFVNKAFATMTGHTVEEIIGMDFRELVAPEDLEMVADRYQRRQAGENVPPEYEFSMLHRDGKTRVLVDMKVSIINYRGRVASMGTVLDITERKRAEMALQASEKKYSTIVEKGNDGIVIVQDGRLKFANPMMAIITGFNIQESIGKPFTDFISPQYRKLVIEKYQNRLSGKELSNKYEIELISKNGRNIPVEINASLIEYEGRPADMAIVRDINDRKISENALQHRIDMEKLIADTSTCFINILSEDIDNNINYTLKKIGEFEGVDRSYVFQFYDNGKKMDNTHEWCAEGIEPQIQNLKKISVDDELPWFSRKIKELEVFQVPLVDDLPQEASNEREHFKMQKIKSIIVVPMIAGGSLIGFLGFDSVRKEKRWMEEDERILKMIAEIFSNAIERKRLDEKLNEEERFMSSIFESIQDGVGIIDKDMNIIATNPTSRKWYPHAPSFIGRKCYEVYHGRSERCEICPSWKTFRTGESAHEVVPKHGQGGKEAGWLEIYSFPLIDTRTGQMNGVIEYVRDITERKLVEEALQKSILQQNAILNNIPDLAWLKDKESRFIAVNQPFAESCGVSSKDLVGKTDFDIWPQGLAERYRADDRDVMESGRRKQVEEPLINKEGEKSWIETIKTPIYSDKGEVIGTTGIARDITERKRAEESLKLFSEAVEEAPDGVQIVDLNGYITYSNRAVEEMYGISAEELKGKHVNDMNVDPGFAGRAIIPSIKETGRWIGELMVKHKSGHEFPIWLTASMVKDRDGRPIAMVGIIRDITERRRIEKALKESEERYRSLFENSPISLWEEDSSRVKKYIENLRNKGVEDFRTYFESHPEEVDLCSTMVRVINVNHATLSLLKASSKDELLKGLNQIFTEHSYDTFREELVAIAEGRTAFEGEDFIKTLTGDVKQIYLKWSVAPGYEGTYSRRHVSIMDITERKRIEDAIKKYASKLEESNRMKELFIDIMHHDLMNPIATASGFIELLKDDEIYKKGYIETIEKNLDRAMDLIECATKFSRIESLEHIEYGDMDLKEVIDGVIENLRPMADKAGMKIENNIGGSMPVKANKIIEDVFANLISNAIKYAHEGKRIIVNCIDKDPFWNVKVIDFGEGLKDIDKTMIFDRFCRIEKKGVKGSGLGLAIAKKIIELHKGGIGIEDNPEGGAIFIIEIPKLKYLDQIH